jgi:ADP-ribosylglycohydrolase
MKVKDGIIGFIVGDALGVPAEFTSREELEENPVTNMIEYCAWNQPKGTWSDDTSMTIATMASIVNKQGIDYDDIMEEFLRWADENAYTNSEDGRFDIGMTTSDALDMYKTGTPALKSGRSGERDNGNGSLMRILPLAYIKDIDYETIENVSALTHAHKRSRIACVLYVEIARSMLENDLTIKEHVEFACDKIKNYYEGSDELKHFHKIFDNDFDEINGKGYVIYTFECVIHSLLTTDNYKDAVLKAINFGGDTDTNAAICGGLAGIYYGFDSIPIDWTSQINKIDEVLSLCEKYEAFCDES